jgi:hypothetical protein
MLPSSKGAGGTVTTRQLLLPAGGKVIVAATTHNVAINTKPRVPSLIVADVGQIIV